jgi:hypothetical protein
MSRFKLALSIAIWICVVCALGLSAAQTPAVSDQTAVPAQTPVVSDQTAVPSVETPATKPDCTNTKAVTTGQVVTLTGPAAPSGVTYDWYWTIVGSDNTVPTGFTPTHAQTVKFTIPDPSTAKDYYVATLLVTDKRTGGCAQSSCLKLIVGIKVTCGLTGPLSICQSAKGDYTYTGTALPSGAVLNWYVDTPLVKGNDRSGKVTIDWSTIPPVGTTTTHVVKVVVMNGDTKLSECSVTVTMLPLPSTTITATAV